MEENRMMSMGCKFDQRPLKFTTGLSNSMHIPQKRPKMPNRDPLSHRIIEKRRRDRMNNCLADLSHLIPASYTKQGQGRIEKTEIIEMAIKYINHLLALIPAGVTHDKPVLKSCCADKKYQGFREASKHVTQFLIEKEQIHEDSSLFVNLQNHLRQLTEELKQEAYSVDIDMSTDGYMNMDTGIITNSESSNHYGSTEQSLSMSPALTTDTKKDCTITSQNTRETQKETQANESSSSGYFGSCELWESQVLQDNETTHPANENNSRHGSVCDSSQSSDRNKEIYKYKNNIQLRFNAMHGDGPAMPDDNGCDKRSKMVSPLESTDSSYYPMSESSSSTSGNSSGSGNCNRPCCRTNSCASNRLHLSDHSVESSIPGFALHKTGTHYVPVALMSSCLSECFNSADVSSGGVFHPISIPVNFGSTFGLFEKKNQKTLPSQCLSTRT